MLRVIDTCTLISFIVVTAYCTSVQADTKHEPLPDERKLKPPVKLNVPENAKAPVSNKWQITEDDNIVIQKVPCKEDNDYCPELRITRQAADEHHNPAFMDRIIAQHIEQLRTQGHETIDYDIEQLGNTSGVRIVSLRKTIKHNTLISLNNKQINTYRFKAHLKYYFFHEKDIKAFVDKLAFDTQ